MNNRDDFYNDDIDDLEELPNATGDAAKRQRPATPPDEQDEFETEFERRQRGAERETAKRQRQAEKDLRETLLEEEIARKQGADKRALEKQRKRRYTELKRLADSLEIKAALQTVTGTVGCDCWGPDVASDKSVPCLGVFVNYLADNNTKGQALTAQAQPPRLFGVWLFFARAAREEITLAIGTKADDDGGQVDRARPPIQADRVLTLRYAEAQHDQIQAQIQTTLLEWQPA